jgi:hypothetical protein
MLYERSLGGEKEKNDYTPFFFRLCNAEEKKELEDLLEKRPQIRVFDTMWAQLKELVKSQKPSITLTMEEIEHDIYAHLNGLNMIEYGVWV